MYHFSNGHDVIVPPGTLIDKVLQGTPLSSITKDKSDAIQFKGPEKIQEGDVMIVASDGVLEVVTIEEVMDFVERFGIQGANKEVSKLLDQRWHQGGYKKDNVMLMLMRAGKHPSKLAQAANPNQTAAA